MNVSSPTRPRAVATLIAGVVAALALGAGTAGAGEASRTGGPVVLRMANGYSDLSYEPAVAYFVKRVREVSHGALRVEVVSEWGNFSPGFEQQVVRDLAAGKADLAWVGTRIFDTLGVRSFQALTAPMLIDSYPLERAVIASPIPNQMLESLGALEVTGLGVLADGLRKPIAVRGSLLAPADWGRVGFAAFRSRGQADAIRSLGGRPSEAWSDALADGLDAGTIQGFEKNLLVYRITGLATAAPYVTANVNLWPQTAALLANPARLAGLTAAQEGWLRRAASDAAARSTGLTDGDSRLVPALCRSGARFANASEADLAALRAAFAPDYARLARDPQTRAFIARIEQLKRTTPAGPALEIPAGCAAPARTTSSARVNTDPSVLNGVYRVSWSEQELLAAGASPGYARGNHGVLTWTLRAGGFVLDFSYPPLCHGTYAVSGATVSIRQGPGCHGVFKATWSLRNGQLRLHVRQASDGGDRALFGAKPWKKIG
jgi:TRAP-type C4-dicarboxylate transport system substrate-binding protein